MQTDDLQEKLRIHELCLLALMRDAFSLRHSLQVIKAYLLTNSTDPEEVKNLLEVAEEVAPELDPDRNMLEQIEAYMELLKSDRPLNKSDA